MSSVKIANDDLVGNIHHFFAWPPQDERTKLDEPVRKWEWGHRQPHQVNAYSSSDRNEIVFLAAIL